MILPIFNNRSLQLFWVAFALSRKFLRQFQPLVYVRGLLPFGLGEVGVAGRQGKAVRFADCGAAHFYAGALRSAVIALIMASCCQSFSPNSAKLGR